MLPNGLTLERRKVRGEISDGMILAEDEVELGADHTGIMLLPDEAEPGTPLADVLPLREAILLVESTGNRPDLLSVYGIAREVAALYDLPLAPQPGSHPDRAAGRDGGRSRSTTSAGCPRYIGRLFEDVAIAPSPLWLKARLLAAGMRPISNVVDVTNYVMLALGNPLHAFDCSTLARRADRRAARAPGERLRTLDGVERELDARRPDDRRRRARRSRSPGSWAARRPRSARRRRRCCSRRRTSSRYGLFRTSERLRLRTEGSNRWEKGVDPYLAEPAANLATQLLLELTGARRWTAHTDVHDELPARPVISLPARARRRGDRRSRRRRTSSGACSGGSASSRAGDDVVAPTWRARDVTREIDVVEEIARFRLEDVPFTLPERRAMFGTLTREQQLRRRVEDALVGLGFAETYTPTLRPDDDDDLEAAGADLGRADGAADVACCRASSRRPPRTSTRARPRSRCSRSRASTCRTASFRTSACASRASPKAASSTARASSRRSTRR